MSEGGFIYAIGPRGSHPVKIGSTTVAVTKRLAQLQTGHHSRLHVIATCEVEHDLGRIERQIHAFLADVCVHGEWFDIAIDPEKLQALLTRAVAHVQQRDAEERERAMQTFLEEERRNPQAALHTFGSRLKRFRESRGWTQQELAARAVVPYMTIWRIEAGKHDYPRMDIAIKLARALKMSLDVLCGVYEEGHKPTALAMAGDRD
jgi:DNA-binding XRE family transcriptional regulator